MDSAAPGIEATGDRILNLVSTALAQTELSGLSEMLKSIAMGANAYGCILWQVVPGSEIDPPRGHLFVLADWFKDNKRCTMHDLPLDHSKTGQAVLSQQTKNVRDAEADEEVFRDGFLIDSKIKAFCSIPITFVDDALGALNLYRNFAQPFSPAEVEQAEQVAFLIPALYHTIRDKVSFNLIGKVDAVLHEADLRAPDEPLSKKEVQQVIQEICQLVSSSFQCIETSVFLEDRLQTPGVFELMGTTWPGPFKKAAYTQDPKEGMTAWVITNAQTVKAFDLANFDENLMEREYPGLSWKDSLDIKTTVRPFMDVSPDEDLPPLSFMAAPIVRGESVYGAIRCSVVNSGPSYFAERELQLLELVAAQVSRYWNNWLSRCELQEGIQSLQGLVESVCELNSFIHRELKKPAPSEQSILNEALAVTASVMKGAEILDVRLVDEAKNELYFAATRGDAWNEGGPSAIQARKQRRFPLDDDNAICAGAHVVRTGEVYVVKDVEKDPYYSVYAPTFPKTRRMIVAPLNVEGGKNASGVLDIRLTLPRNPPRYATLIAALLGRQLALYRFLIKTIGKLQAAVSELKRLQSVQVQVFQVMDHQFKSPIIQAHARAQRVLGLVNEEGKLKSELWAIRGLCGKAKRVSLNSGLFASLASGEEIKLGKKLIIRNELIKLLIEAAQDNSLMIPAKREIRYSVDRTGFARIRTVCLDKYLLEQAITNVLDNAFKYSYEKTQIKVSGGLTGKGRFQIAIVNVGIPVRTHELSKCIERGWQSERAKWVSGGGKGIGLWIVSHIMKAHHGELIIVPTTSDHKTEVKLVFPMKEDRDADTSS